MRGVFRLLLMLATAGTAAAHVGFENETEIRIHADDMRLVVRTSLPFAWTLLGARVPATNDEAGQAMAKPLLIEAAPSLFEVSAGGEAMLPRETDCLFEVHEDVAFVLTFDRPTKWPVVIEAKFFPILGSLDTGSIKVFDYTKSRFSRDLEPLVQQRIDRDHPSLSFSLEAPEIPAPVTVAPKSQAPHKSRIPVAGVLLIVSTVIVGWLARKRLRNIGDKS